LTAKRPLTQSRIFAADCPPYSSWKSHLAGDERRSESQINEDETERGIFEETPQTASRKIINKTPFFSVIIIECKPPPLNSYTSFSYSLSNVMNHLQEIALLFFVRWIFLLEGRYILLWVSEVNFQKC
jgi:hypothetical protein